MDNIKIRMSVNYICQYDAELVYDLRVDDQICGVFVIDDSRVEEINNLFSQ